ncbi:MAG TPA: NADH-quinone oxidoreductase subunit L, partial [Methanomicrobiales archaeon]|nr:NADH-quinone oxidoreductase subunit L [Methanomicrobiales archaeon]
YLIEPYVTAIYGTTPGISQTNIAIMMLMLALLLILPISFMLFRRSAKHLPPYMSGRPTTADMHFLGSMGVEREMTTRNYYLTQYFGEKRLLLPGTVICAGLILVSWLLAGVAA